MRKPKDFFIVGKKIYGNVRLQTSDASSISIDLFSAKELRRFAKWANKAADYLESKEKERGG